MTTSVVEVYDRTALDALLQTKWTALKDALRGGNIDKALEFVAVTVRQEYRKIFEALLSRPSQVDAALTEIHFVSLHENRAEYQMIQVEEGVRLSHFILFERDIDGLWRLKFL